jgi:hypothetical protein
LDHSWLLYVERMRVNMSSFYFLKRPERKWMLLGTLWQNVNYRAWLLEGTLTEQNL